MNKKNIVLVAFYDIDSFPVCTLHAVLKRAGFEVVSLFFKQLNPNNTMSFPTPREIECLTQRVQDLNPLFVGMSVRSTHYKLAVEITQKIKEVVDTVVLWGGVHATIRPEQCLQHADIVCVGEGEGAVVELAERLKCGKPVGAINNLWVKDCEHVVRNELRPLIQDLDQLPFPDFTDNDKCLLERGVVKPYPKPLRKLSYWIMTSRGCPFSCSYCCNNVLRRVYDGKGPYIRRRSVKNVIEELVAAKKQFPNLSFIAFEDDVFAMNYEWVKDFAPKYKQTIGLPFFCYCYPSSVTEPLVKLLKDAGVQAMTMGIQAGSPAIRRDCYGRRESDEQILQAAAILNRYSINRSFDIILDSRIESTADKQATFDLVSRLPRPFELHTHTLTHFPETDLTKMLLRKQLIEEADVEDQQQKSYQRWTPKLDLKRSKDDLYWDNLYYLFGINFISTRAILRISKIRCLKDYPHLMTLALIVTRKINSMFGQILRAFRFLFRKIRRLWKIGRVSKDAYPVFRNGAANDTREEIPLVSIALAVFNGSRFLEAQIRSILEQKYSNWEIIAVDDASTDDSFNILKEFARKDERIKVWRNEVNAGIVKNFLNALRFSCGEFVCFSDQDDVWRSDKLEVLVSLITKSSRNMLAYSDLEICDSDLKRIDESFWQSSGINPRRGFVGELAFLRNIMPGCSLMIRKEVKEILCRLPLDSTFMHDHLAFIVSAALGNIVYSKAALVKYRQHADNRIGAFCPSVMDRGRYYSQLQSEIALLKDVLPVNLSRLQQFAQTNVRSNILERISFLDYYFFLRRDAALDKILGGLECFFPRIYEKVRLAAHKNR